MATPEVIELAAYRDNSEIRESFAVLESELADTPTEYRQRRLFDLVEELAELDIADNTQGEQRLLDELVGKCIENSQKRSALYGQIGDAQVRIEGAASQAAHRTFRKQIKCLT